ncbi:MAG: RluA family pseudouridine synthase [Gammaproteobacteria bacterium]|nr:MAG: RluA family pseudouridine synthase [Gammaproteobacteria bacterium]
MHSGENGENEGPGGPDGDRRQVSHVQIGAAESGQRIDNFLLTRLKGVPRSRIYRLLRKGEVRVNGKRTKPVYRLEAGDRVRIPPVRTARRRDLRVPEGVQDEIRAAIIHEDPEVLVVDKPAGMAVHAGSETPWGVIEALRCARPDEPFLELAHRLDRGTSGCLVLARSRPALLALQAALSDAQATKRYLALVKGPWPDGVRSVDAPLRRNVLRGGERVVQVDPAGKTAITRFKVLELMKGSALMEATLVTGRTHQIRVHAASVGSPVAGDSRYGNPRFNAWARGLGLKRMFLHAQSVSLPLENRELNVDAPLPADLRAVLVKAQSGRG